MAVVIEGPVVIEGADHLPDLGRAAEFRQHLLAILDRARPASDSAVMALADHDHAVAPGGRWSGLSPVSRGES
jgi:hypothetical protein